MKLHKVVAQTHSHSSDQCCFQISFIFNKSKIILTKTIY